MRHPNMRFFSLGMLTFVATMLGGFFMAGEDASAAGIRGNCSKCKSDLVVSPDGACAFGNQTGGSGCTGYCMNIMGHVTCTCIEFGDCAGVIRL
jgi:hypothetical protein